MYLSKVELSILLMCNVFTLCSLTERCSPEYCNFAGECKIVKKKPTCKCYAEAFQGKYCEQVKNLCETEKNSCSAKQICIPYVGQTICDCLPKRSGNDSCERTAATKLMCSYNVRAVYGVFEQMVLSFKSLGTEPFQITISTPTYLIGYVPRSDLPGSRKINSQYTKNLTAVLQGLGIRRHTKLPYNECQYYVFPAKHFTLGTNQISVTIDFFERRSRSQSQSLTMVVHVVQPRFSSCIPHIVFQHCMNPMKPRQVDIERFTNIQAIVEKRCSHFHTSVKAHWNIQTAHENFFEYSTQAWKHILLKIPRYTLWYNEILHSYPNLLLTVQLALKEGNSAWVYARVPSQCYINVTARNVVAHIAGGHYREVSRNSKWLILDGSKSREPAQNVNHPQQLTYTWIISSENGSNKQYLTQWNIYSKINISTKILKNDTKNIITLTVANTLVNARSNSISQEIVVTSDNNQHSIDIDCIKNCQRNLYTPDYVLHLLAVCPTCRMPISYTWTLNGVDMRQNRRRLVTKLATELGDELVVKLNIKDLYGEGNAELRLQVAQPPISGDCEIEPRNGQECITKFKIRCQNVTSPSQEPILYTFKTGSIVEDISDSGETFLYLNGNESLTVHICDSHISCTLVTVPFSVEPIKLTGSKVFQTYDLVNMLIAGKRQQVFCFLHKISSDPQNINAVSKFLKSIEFDSADTVIEMVNSLNMAYKIISRVGSLESKDVNAIAFILKRVTISFDIVRKDTEILDMSEETCLDLGRMITNIITYFMKVNTELMKQNMILWDFENPFHEDYTDWFPFDSKIALHIRRYDKIVTVIFTIWQTIGIESTRYIQPEEPFEYVSKNVSYRLQMHDTYGPIKYSSVCESCHLTVPVQEVEAQRMMLRSQNLLVHAWCFKSDIFWWAPERIPPSTVIFAVNILGSDAPYKLIANSSQKYDLRLRRVKNTILFRYDQTDVIFRNILIYKIKLQGQLNMLVNVLSCTAPLRILITMDVEPTWRILHDTSCFVPKGSNNSTIILKNRCIEDRMAYIAVYKANSHDKKPAQYTFRISVQECNVWGQRGNDPNWEKGACYSRNLEQGSDYSKFQADHLSMFSGKEYELKPFSLRGYTVIPPLNIGCVVFNCILFLGSLSLLILATLRWRHVQKNLIRVIKWDYDEVDPQTENIILHVRTGGRILGKTTSNVKLVFNSDLGRYKVIIYQNPISPQFTANTSCLLRLSDNKVQLPCRLTISHDLSGRFPSWYCRAIQMDDLRRELSYTFRIHAWIRRGQKIIVSCLPAELTSNKLQLHRPRVPVKYFGQLLQRFRYYIKFYFTNWFMMQPILGPWRFTDESCNIYERTCIWICKMLLTVTIVFCYYRYTSSVVLVDPSEDTVYTIRL